MRKWYVVKHLCLIVNGQEYDIYLLCVVASSVFRYLEYVVWGDKTLNLKLLRKGILTRIYAPMVSVISIPNSKSDRLIS